MTVLVGYASARWSTKAIAEEIGAQLMKGGVNASIRPLAEVDGLTHYDSVVVGSPTFRGEWLAEAAAFLTRHEAELIARPFWLFSVSPVGNVSSLFGPSLTRGIRRTREPTSVLVDARQWPRFRGHRAFAGAIERGHWSWAGDLLLKLCGGVVEDRRAWLEIDEWARGIASQVLAVEWAKERRRLRLVPPLDTPSRAR